jgi:hypothetical protein
MSLPFVSFRDLLVRLFGAFAVNEIDEMPDLLAIDLDDQIGDWRFRLHCLDATPGEKELSAPNVPLQLVRSKPLIRTADNRESLPQDARLDSGITVPRQFEEKSFGSVCSKTSVNGVLILVLDVRVRSQL